MEITFINVGYGESILITEKDPERPDGQFVMLIDGGSSLDSEYTGTSGRIRSFDFLGKRGIRHIDVLVFSHVHEDHTCGLAPIIAGLPVGQYWTSVEMDPAKYGQKVVPGTDFSETNRKALQSINVYSELMQKLSGQDVRMLSGIIQGYFRAGELSFDVLGPEESYKRSVENAMDQVFTSADDASLDAAVTKTTETMNNASLILRLHYRGRRVLLCGDTNACGFSHIPRELLKADVYKIGHHGQADSVTEELVRAVDPSVIVCCASNDFRSNSSNEKTFETIRKTMGEKPVTYLFQDGCYNARWNENTAPRNGVLLNIDDEGIRWELIQP